MSLFYTKNEEILDPPPYATYRMRSHSNDLMYQGIAGARQSFNAAVPNRMARPVIERSFKLYKFIDGKYVKIFDGDSDAASEYLDRRCSREELKELLFG